MQRGEGLPSGLLTEGTLVLSLRPWAGTVSQVSKWGPCSHHPQARLPKLQSVGGWGPSVLRPHL